MKHVKHMLALALLLAGTELFAATPPAVKHDTVYLNTNAAILDYQRGLNADMIAHRDYVESYYTKLYALVAGVILALAGVGVKGYLDTKKLMEDRLRKRLDQIVDASIQASNKKIDVKIAAFEAALQAKSNEISQLQREVSTMQEELLRGLDYREFSVDGLAFASGKHSLEYVSANGELVRLSCHQTFVNETDAAIPRVRRTYEVGGGGKIVDIKSSPADLTVVQNLDAQRTFYIETPMLGKRGDTLTNEILVDFYNGYLEEQEFYDVNKLHKSEDDTFVLKCPKERLPKGFTVRKTDLQTKAVDNLTISPHIDETGTHKLYTFRLPDEFPAQYRIAWKF